MPPPFDGTRGTVDLFLQTFNFYRNANCDNEVMRNPFQRANLLLTFMKGPRIQMWAAKKGEELTMAVFGDPANNVQPTHLREDEGLWNGLVQALRTQFAELHGEEGAYRKIKRLKQMPGNVEDYITAFEMLLLKAGWGRDSHGAISAFKEGLCEPLLKECIRRRPKPVTLTEWMDTARDEEKSYYDLKFELEEAKKRCGGRRLEDLAEDARKGNKRPAGDVDPRPYDPMQLDAARTQKRLSDEERQKLRNEGRCFGCESTKHMYDKCPKNPRVRGKGKKRQESPKASTKPRARVADASATIEEVSSEDEEEEEPKKEEAPPPYTKKKLVTAIRKLSSTDREDLMDTLAIDSDQDF
jgi:hypothetical protein